MSKDQAARIAEKALGDYEHDTSHLARSIRRAITSAVRKERERCVKCACKEFGFVHHKTLDAIIKAITGNKRKGKR